MWDDEKQEEENKVYQELFDNWFSDQLEDLGNKITEQEVNDDIQGFITDYEVSTENLIDTPLMVLIPGMFICVVSVNTTSCRCRSSRGNRCGIMSVRYVQWRVHVSLHVLSVNLF